MTKARTAVMSVLNAATQPLSAAGVLELIGDTCDPATVYRTLHYLEDAELAESFVLSCAEHGVERYYTSRATPHRHWFHCESCHRFFDIGICRMGSFVAQLEHDMHLRVSRHTLYLTGRCATCSSARPRARRKVRR